MSYIVKCSVCEPSIESFHILRPYLPEEYEYMVCSFTINGPNFKTRLRTSGKNQDYAQKWLEDFQMHSKCTMRVERTYPHSGTKNVFKIDLRCQHNTRPRGEKVREKEFCKNTDCPAKMGITIKRVMTERKSRSKDLHLPSYPTVLQMDFCHNHPISTPEILRHRSVLPEVREKILNLFKLGHNPTTALDMHKYDLQLEHGENYGKVSQDRALLPDGHFCYRLYYKILRKQVAENGESIDTDSLIVNGPDEELDVKPATSNLEKSSNESSMEDTVNDCVDDSSNRKSKKKRKLEYSFIDRNKMATQLEDVLCKFCESGGFAGMQIIDDNTVMALCTPLMQRVHALVKQSAELVFIDAYGELDEPNACRVLMFVTYSCAGALPLGCLVTTSATADCIKAALDLWKQILPDGWFYGRTEGPQIFLTNDCEAEKQSLKSAFPQSQLLVCISHILQSSWTFLWDRKNAVKKEHRSLLFSKVKMLLFSQTIEELEMSYAYSIQDNLVKTYAVFVDHLNVIYNHRHDWSLVYRRHLLPRGDISVFWEAAMILLKDPILSRTRTFNPLQIIDFLSRLDTYYERCLIDIANNRLDSVKNSRFLFIEMPQEAYTITQKSESEYEVHNDTKDTTYQLDITLGMCECRTGKNGAPCKHQLLVFKNFVVPSYDCIPISAQNEKALLFHLATGQELENGPNVDVASTVHNLLPDACSDITMHDLTPCSQSTFFLADSDTCESLSHGSVLNHNGMTSHEHSINQQDVAVSSVSQHLSLNHHVAPLPQQSMQLNHHAINIDHTNNINHHPVPHVQSNVVPMVQHTNSIPPHTTTSQQSHIMQLSPPPPSMLPEMSSPTHSVHELIDQACTKLKDRTTRMPQTFIPALDTFLKNLDRLSSDSSLEYALYSFGKFSKSAMPLFKRKVVNNKLVGLQSAGELKKKTHQANNNTSKIAENSVPH